MKQNILITGATGFVGKNVIEMFLQSQEYNLIAFLKEDDIVGKAFLDEYEIEYITSFDLAFNKKIDYCIHLASYGVAYGDRNLDLMIDVNIKFAEQVASFCHKNGCKLFINTGSCFEYGSLVNDRLITENDKLEPEDLYAATKVACEDVLKVYCKIMGLKIITIRPFSIFGKYEPSSRLVPLIFENGIQNKHLSLTEGNQIRDYMDVRDVAKAIFLLIKNSGKIGNTYSINISSGTPYRLKDFISLIVETCGFNYINFGFGEKEYRSNESMFFVGDNRVLFDIIGKQDFSISKKKILDAYKFYVESK